MATVPVMAARSPVVTFGCFFVAGMFLLGLLALVNVYLGAAAVFGWMITGNVALALMHPRWVRQGREEGKRVWSEGLGPRGRA